ncbi:MAG: hypothetical protein AABY22_11600 [Nanoarchaeota archaeon]
MVTAFEAFNQYCWDNTLPTPSKNDLQNAGRIISSRFRNYWGLAHPEEVPNAGFKLSAKEGCLVIGYPEKFLTEMYDCIKYFIGMKEKRMNKEREKPPQITKAATSEPKKKKRERKPIPVNKYPAK